MSKATPVSQCFDIETNFSSSPVIAPSIIEIQKIGSFEQVKSKYAVIEKKKKESIPPMLDDPPPPPKGQEKRLVPITLKENQVPPPQLDIDEKLNYVKTGGGRISHVADPKTVLTRLSDPHGIPNLLVKFHGIDHDLRMYAESLCHFDEGAGDLMGILERNGVTDKGGLWFEITHLSSTVEVYNLKTTLLGIKDRTFMDSVVSAEVK